VAGCRARNGMTSTSTVAAVFVRRTSFDQSIVSVTMAGGGGGAGAGGDRKYIVS